MVDLVKVLKNKIASQKKTHAPQRFLYLRETTSWWCEGGEEEEGGEGEEKVHLLTHATTSGMGKNRTLDFSGNPPLWT